MIRVIAYINIRLFGWNQCKPHNELHKAAIQARIDELTRLRERISLWQNK